MPRLLFELDDAAVDAERDERTGMLPEIRDGLGEQERESDGMLPVRQSLWA